MKIGRAIVVLALCAAPLAAWAQASPVFQSGLMTAPHDLAKLTRNGQIQDAGGLLGDSSGRGVNPFAVQDSLALGLCSNSAKTGGQYNALCLGHDGSGNGLITLDSFGGLGNTGLNVRINGVVYPFPGAGNGNVTGPTAPAATAGDLVCWNGGTAQKDCTTVANPVVVANTITATVQNTAARTSSSWNHLFRDNTSSQPSDFTTTGNFDNVVSLVTAPNGTTLINTTAFAAYIHNQTPNVTPPDSGNSVLYYGIIKSETNGAHSWGLNPVMNDQVGLTGVVMQNEFDVNVFSTFTKAYGLVVTGASTVNAADSGGVVVASPSIQSPGTAKWTRSFWSQDAASPLAMEVGATGVAGASVNSQTLRLHYYNSGSIIENVDLLALNNGQLAVDSFITGGSTGIGLFNNLSTTANTASGFNATTISGSALITQVEAGGGASQMDITETGTGGIVFFPGAGGMTASGTSVWTANGAVATTMTSLGPTGAHTTVQEWFTVKDTAGTVRYIPAY